MAEVTGRHVFAITFGAFAIIIGVNVLLAVKAVSTFPGLEVQNSYVAGQGFDTRKSAQEALGWVVTTSYVEGRIALEFADRSGLPVSVQDLDVLIGRTTSSADDKNPLFHRDGTNYVANLTLGPGKWMIKVTALAKDGTYFEQRSELFVKG